MDRPTNCTLVANTTLHQISGQEDRGVASQRLPIQHNLQGNHARHRWLWMHHAPLWFEPPLSLLNDDV